MQAPTLFDPGAQVSVVWQTNPGGRVLVKSNRVNGQKTPKIVLVDNKYEGRLPNPDEKWLCQVSRHVNPTSATSGAYLVMPLRQEIAMEFPDVWIPDDIGTQMQIALQTPGKNLFLQGDQGCGKTTMASAIALGLGWEFCKVSGGSIKKYVYMLTRVMPSEQDGRLTFREIDSDLAAYIKEAQRNLHKIYLIAVDEYTRMEVNARDIMLDAIEGERFLPMPNGDKLFIPPNVKFMAMGNVGSRFTVQKQDDANRSRWIVLKVDYMPADEEFKLLTRRYPRCPQKELRRAIEIANVCRDRRFATNADKLSKGVSTRETDNVAMFLQGGEPLLRALKTSVVHQYDGDERDTASEAYKVWQLIQAELKAA